METVLLGGMLVHEVSEISGRNLLVRKYGAKAIRRGLQESARQSVSCMNLIGCLDGLHVHDGDHGDHPSQITRRHDRKHKRNMRDCRLRITTPKLLNVPLQGLTFSRATSSRHNGASTFNSEMSA